MAALAKQGEAGLGDVYLRLIESPTASLWRGVAEQISAGCGCVGNRAGWLNARFRLATSEAETTV